MGRGLYGRGLVCVRKPRKVGDAVPLSAGELGLRQRAVDIIKAVYYNPRPFDVTEGIFVVLYVSVMGLTRFYKTTVFTFFFTKQLCHNDTNDTLLYQLARTKLASSCRM